MIEDQRHVNEDEVRALWEYEVPMLIGFASIRTGLKSSRI